MHCIKKWVIDFLKRREEEKVVCSECIFHKKRCSTNECTHPKRTTKEKDYITGRTTLTYDWCGNHNLDGNCFRFKSKEG
jgi:hypothetical protein